ncbi:MAG: hypothetical protein R2738_06785 [Bacteroides graminisolvens]
MRFAFSTVVERSYVVSNALFADLLKTAPSMDGLLQSINQPARWVFGKASGRRAPYAALHQPHR